MSTRGYYRHPTIHDDSIVFVSEDDLWSVGSAGGEAHRLTANPGRQAFPRFSPNGELVAFVSRDEGVSDVFVMPSQGGRSTRLTFFGANTHVVGWRPTGTSVIVATDYRQPFVGSLHLWEVPLDGSMPTPMDLGPARAVSFSGRKVVLGRNSFDPARWKRYRGGRTGSLWIDKEGSGEFSELLREEGNLADPMWIGNRIYFLSDHEGVGNLYSVTPGGRSLKRHTNHQDFYVRFPSTDGRRIVYHCGADLWVFDPASGEATVADVRIPSARPQLNRRFIAPGKFLETYDLHPVGHSLALTVRGGAYTAPLWEGSVRRHGPTSRHRQRLACWLPGGDRILSVTDEKGEESLVIRPIDGSDPTFIERDFGRIRSLDAAPAGPSRVALTNHRHEVLLVDLVRKSSRVVYRSEFTWIRGTSWSSDGRWLAFSGAKTPNTMNLFLYDTADRRLHEIGRPEFVDYAPSFDPEGKYLYYLSRRIFDPVADSAFHDFAFPLGTVPMAIALAAATRSPFDQAARAPRPPGGSAEGNGKANAKDSPAAVEIDVDGLADRTYAFPLPAGRYARIAAGVGRVFLLHFPLRGSLGSPGVESTPPAGSLGAWDLSADKLDALADGVSSFSLSADRKTLAIRFGRKLRVVAAGWKEDKNSKEQPGRDSGWIDLSRVRVEIDPTSEWHQMFSEAWRLQRDHFWWEEMGGVDWLAIHDRYSALVDRVGSRSEFSDLMWEMQGELGTSHAYELGGDYRPEPAWSQGFLGADLRWFRGAWRVDSIPEGDPWNDKAASPLAAAGVKVKDRVLSLDGRSLGPETPVEQLLVDLGERPVTLEVATGRQKPRMVVVTPLKSETALRYRDWVAGNRRAVAEATAGRAGYIHIPDMGPAGFAEFHRAFRHEVTKDGLLIDVRFNRGGNVSQLLLQKLLRKRLGYQITRWRQPLPVPDDSPAGPMVCVTNEYSGSDGDIFSHTFKMARLGPLIGTRTWGGVIGIWPQQSLVDGTVTTQPEFALWFSDVGYRIENYGTDPDIEVINTPADYRQGVDRQLERGISELVRIMDEAGPAVPDFGERPSVRPPRLPS